MVVGADRVNIEVFSLALAHFAQAVSAGSDRHVVLVLDRAGWHKSGEVLMPEGIHLLFLPPYSPELQRGSTSLAAHQRASSPIVASSRLTSCVAGASRAVCRSQRTIHSVFVGTRFSDFRPLSGHAKQT
jgi:hypothetical protein